MASYQFHKRQTSLPVCSSSPTPADMYAAAATARSTTSHKNSADDEPVYSSLYGFLPSVISNRVPKLPSLRRTLSSTRPVYVAESSSSESESGSESGSESVYPGPGSGSGPGSLFSQRQYQHQHCRPASSSRVEEISRRHLISRASWAGPGSGTSTPTPPPTYYASVRDDLLLNPSIDSSADDLFTTGTGPETTETDVTSPDESMDEDLRSRARGAAGAARGGSSRGFGFFERRSTTAGASLNEERERAREKENGVVWRFATQGLTLLTQAHQESASVQQDRSANPTPAQTKEAQASAAFARQLYLHAVGYILRGLPPNLSFEETLAIKSALPAPLSGTMRVAVNAEGELAMDATAHAHSRSGSGFDAVSGYSAGAGSGGYGADAQISRRNANQPSLVHRLLAASIIQLFLLAHFLLPYIKLLAAAAWRYEREHRVSERVVGLSVDALDGMSRAVWRVNDGKLGRLIEGVGAWWIRGIAGGLHDGVGEGMGVFGLGPGAVAGLGAGGFAEHPAMYVSAAQQQWARSRVTRGW